MKLIDLTNKKYGKWKVIKLIRKDNQIFWECECECGNRKFIEGAKLRNGDSKSCGTCSRGKNLIDKKFGRLLVLNKTKNKSKTGYNQWLCKCECGKKL